MRNLFDNEAINKFKMYFLSRSWDKLQELWPWSQKIGGHASFWKVFQEVKEVLLVNMECICSTLLHIYGETSNRTGFMWILEGQIRCRDWEKHSPSCLFSFDFCLFETVPKKASKICISFKFNGIRRKYIGFCQTTVY